MATPQTHPTFTPSESPMEQLVKLSRFYGSDPEIVLTGGGNTSVKTGGQLHVKASGHALATIGLEGFVALDRNRLVELLSGEVESDVRRREERFKDAILAARLEPAKNQRPSVECVLHALLPCRFVVHTHPALVNMLACCARGAERTTKLFGPEVLWLPAGPPGLMLARALADAVAACARRTGRACPEAVVMQNHGLVVCGETAAEVVERTDRILLAIRRAIDASGTPRPFGEPRRIEPARARELVNGIAPALRGLLATGERLKVVAFDDEDAVLSLVGAPGGRQAALAGPLIPDHIVYCTSMPLWLPAPETAEPDRLVPLLRQAVQAHAGATGSLPNVVLVEGLGMFAAGDDVAAAETVRQVYRDAISVLEGAARLGGVQPMSEQDRRFIETWEVEAYRRGISAGKGLRGRVAGKVALVTGAAQGFGREIAEHLAGEGAHVVLLDLNEEGVRQAAEALCGALGAGRAIGLCADVTDGDSLAAAVHRAVRAYGGLDVVVSNAGVLRAGSVKTQPAAEFDLVTAVNYRGYFLCVQKTAPILAVQHRAKADFLGDILQINSKSGLEGSNRNAAYAGSKFGGIGLTQSFAMELIEDGIKVNAICPGNYFDGPLWSDPANGLFAQYLRSGKVPGAKTVEDVRRAYEAKVPLGRGCTTADVMAAVYYLIEQRYETGQALPVTGGQVMLR